MSKGHRSTLCLCGEPPGEVEGTSAPLQKIICGAIHCSDANQK